MKKTGKIILTGLGITAGLGCFVGGTVVGTNHTTSALSFSIEEKNSENQKLSDSLKQKDSIIASQKNKLQEKDSVIDSQKSKLQEKDAEIETLKEQASAGSQTSKEVDLSSISEDIDMLEGCVKVDDEDCVFIGIKDGQEVFYHYSFKTKEFKLINKPAELESNLTGFIPTRTGCFFFTSNSAFYWGKGTTDLVTKNTSLNEGFVNQQQYEHENFKFIVQENQAILIEDSELTLFQLTNKANQTWDVKNGVVLLCEEDYIKFFNYETKQITDSGKINSESLSLRSIGEGVLIFNTEGEGAGYFNGNDDEFIYFEHLNLKNGIERAAINGSDILCVISDYESQSEVLHLDLEKKESQKVEVEGEYWQNIIARGNGFYLSDYNKTVFIDKETLSISQVSDNLSLYDEAYYDYKDGFFIQTSNWSLVYISNDNTVKENFTSLDGIDTACVYDNGILISRGGMLYLIKDLEQDAQLIGYGNSAFEFQVQGDEIICIGGAATYSFNTKTETIKLKSYDVNIEESH